MQPKAKRLPMLTVPKFLKIGLVLAAVALAGCNEATYKDYSAKASKQLPPEIVKKMQAKGMQRNSPVMARILKEEGKVEIWKQKTNGRYDVIAEYDICKFSGKLGPKFIEGDRQAPEGFYTVRPAQMNPNSQYHLSFNMGYPNAFDRAHGRTGSNLMVHGGCSSSGCYSMTDEQVEQIYAFGRDAFAGGQTEFQIQAFPFRMTAANMARYKDDPNYAFWQNLKEGWDHFELTKVPPKVDVCEKRYVFNAVTDGTFNASGQCPTYTYPDTLASAYQSLKSKDAIMLSSASTSGAPASPSILGLAEAKVIAEWTRKRARGERVTLEPPTLKADGTVVASTSRMGRIDSPAGRRQAELDAKEAAKKKAEEEKVAAKKRAEEAKIAKANAEAAAEQAAAEAAAAPVVEAAPAEEEKPGLLGRVGKAGKRLTNLFGS